MLVPAGLEFLIMVLVLLAFTVIGSVLIKKFGFSFPEEVDLAVRSSIASALGLLLVFPLFLAFRATSNRLYIVTGEPETKSYSAFGSAEYEMPDGSIIPVNRAGHNCEILNLTEEIIVLEEIIYSASPQSELLFSDEEAAFLMINPGELLGLEIDRIDYLPEDTPPEEISTNQSQESKFWLHRLNF